MHETGQTAETGQTVPVLFYKRQARAFPNTLVS